MKPRFLANLHIIAFVLASDHQATADDAVWNGTTDADWATPTNWSSDPNPVPGTGNTATFNNAGGLDDVIDLGAGVTISSIIFNTVDAAAYTIGSGGTTGTAGAKTLTVTTSAGNVAISGAVSNGGATSLALTKTGPGTLTLSGSNTYSGATTVNGTLTINGTGNIVPATGALLTIGSSGGSGVMQYDSTSVTASKFGAANIGNGTNNSGTLNQTAGSISGTTLTLAATLGNGIGTINLSGGTLALTGAAKIGARNSSSTPVASALTLSNSASFTSAALTLATDSGYNAGLTSIRLAGRPLPLRLPEPMFRHLEPRPRSSIHREHGQVSHSLRFERHHPAWWPPHRSS